MNIINCGDCGGTHYGSATCPYLKKAAEEPTAEQLAIRDELAKEMRLQPGPGFGKREQSLTITIRCNECGFTTEDMLEAIKHASRHGWSGIGFTDIADVPK